MDKSWLMGIDIGTQGTKVLVIDQQGNMIAEGGYSYPFDVPKTGWAEQDPCLWWHAVQMALKQIWDKGVNADQIGSIGVSGQMHSLVLLDKNEQELGNAILWNDVRTEQECEEMEAVIGKEQLHAITQNAVLPGFTAPKLLWIKKHEPDRFSKIRHVMLPKDYIVYKLSGIFASDVSDASGTALFDTPNRTWSKEIIDLLAIPFEWLPAVYESKTVVGHVSHQAAEQTGLKTGISIIAGAGDNAAAALGNGIYQEGDGLVSVGTSGTVFAPLKKLPKKGAQDNGLKTLHLFCHCVPGTWHAMGVTLSAGMSLNWFKQMAAEGMSYEELIADTAAIPAGSDGLCYLPYLNGERTPHNNPDARGVFFGIHYKHTRHHFTKAVLEGVSYSLKDCYELIKQCGVSVDKLYVTGGASKNGHWRQILADVLETDLAVYDGREGPAYGAALLAGLGIGVWENPADFPAVCENRKTTAVIPANAKIYKTGYHTFQQLYKQLKPLF